jgi:hypothetical protein
MRLRLWWKIISEKATATIIATSLELNCMQKQVHLDYMTLNRYIESPNTLDNKQKCLNFGAVDVDSAEVLAVIFLAIRVVPRPENSDLIKRLELKAKEAFAARRDYEPFPTTDWNLKKESKLSNLYEAQTRGSHNKKMRTDFYDYLVKKSGVEKHVVPKFDLGAGPLGVRHYVLRDGRFITFDNSKWFDHRERKVGDSSMALVGHIMRARPCEAGPIAAMKKHFGLYRTKKAVDYYRRQSSVRAYVSRFMRGQDEILRPRLIEEKWPVARSRLLESGLEASVVDHYHQKGLIYANARGFIVFLCEGQGQFLLIKGLNGTENDRWWWPSDNSGPFILRVNNQESAKVVKSKEGGLSVNNEQLSDPKKLILTNNPLTALKAKAVHGDKEIWAIGPSIQLKAVYPMIMGRKISLVAENKESFESLTKQVTRLSVCAKAVMVYQSNRSRPKF